MLKVSRMYLNKYGGETVKCSAEGKFSEVECDITDGKVIFYSPQDAGFKDYCEEFYRFQDLFTIVHKNNEQRRLARKKVKTEKQIIDKNPWYTKNDRTTQLMLSKLHYKVKDILIEYIDKYPTNMLTGYYSELLKTAQMSKPIWKELPLDKSNKLPWYDKNTMSLHGSTSSIMFLIRVVYGKARKASRSKVI